MPGVVRAITRIQDADDFSGTLTDTYIPVWSNSQQKFVMTAQSVTAPGGSSGYIQYNNAGAFGASGVYWDAVNSRLGLGTSTPTVSTEIVGKTIFGTYGLFDPSLFNEMTIGHKSLAAFSTNFAFTQNSSGQTTFNGLELFFRTANNTKMYLSPAGRLGINTTSPSQTLDVNGSLNVATALVSPDIRPASNAVNSTGFSSASGTRILSVDTVNGRVGIGTTSPNNKLDVAGTVQMDGLRIDVTPASETITCTHTITLSADGTNYKIPCAAA